MTGEIPKKINEPPIEASPDGLTNHLEIGNDRDRGGESGQLSLSAETGSFGFFGPGAEKPKETRAEMTNRLLDLAEGFPRRIPVLSKEDAEVFSGLEGYKTITRQWVEITAFLKEKMLRNQRISLLLSGHIGDAVSESLPLGIINAISSVDPDFSKECASRPELMYFLAVPAVPDEFIKYKDGAGNLGFYDKWLPPDELLREIYREITFYNYNRHASEETLNRESEIRFLAALGGGKLAGGITEGEKNMVERRYAMARDLKVLMLGAELSGRREIMFSNGDEIVMSDSVISRVSAFFRKRKSLEDLGQGEFRVLKLPSGAEIGFLTDDLPTIRGLLSPDKWVYRKWTKDRIHMGKIEIGDGGAPSVVIKERKSGRHRDGLVDIRTNSSDQEARIAEYLHRHGERRNEDILTRWEKPLGYVKFPDHESTVSTDPFQFSLFEFEPDLVHFYEKASDMLARALLADPEELKIKRSGLLEQLKNLATDPEFKEVIVSFQSIMSNEFFRLHLSSSILPTHYSSEEEKSLIAVDIEHILDVLSDDDFAKMSAERMMRKGVAMGHGTLDELGYMDQDSTDCAYKINPGSKDKKLEVFYFDTEYVVAVENDLSPEALKERKLAAKVERIKQYYIRTSAASLGAGYSPYCFRDPFDNNQKEEDVEVINYKEGVERMRKDLPNRAVLYLAMLFIDGLINHESMKRLAESAEKRPTLSSG